MTDPAGARNPQPRPRWTFLTNHGHVLLMVASGQDLTVAEIAGRIGITPRATLNILSDLEDGGYLRRDRVGRRTRYAVDPHQHFRHQLTADHEIGELLAIFSDSGRDSRPADDLSDALAALSVARR